MDETTSKGKFQVPLGSRRRRKVFEIQSTHGKSGPFSRPQEVWRRLSGAQDDKAVVDIEVGVLS